MPQQVQHFASFLLLTLSINQFGSIFSFRSNTGWISATVNMADGEDIEGEDVDEEEDVLPTCANILASSFLQYDTCAKISLFSFKPNLFKRIQTMWIHKCFVLRGFEKKLQLHDGFSEISTL